MPRLPKIIPVSELDQDAAPLLVSPEAYQQVGSERQILRILAEGEKEIAEGHGFDLDVVLTEVDALLSLTE